MHFESNSNCLAVSHYRYNLITRARNILTVFICFLVISVEASQIQEIASGNTTIYTFRQFNDDKGLSQNLISSIHQDHLGFIWIGTKDGLNLFDGYSFKIFKYEPSNEHSLSDNYITTIYEDHLQRLWIGTYSGGLHYFDRERGQFTRFSHNPEDENSISNNHIQAIAVDKNGHLWAGTNGGGVNKFIFPGNDDSGSINSDSTRIIRYNSFSSGFPETGARISTLIHDSQDRMWIGTQNNIFTFDPLTKEPLFTQIPVYQGKPVTSTSQIREDVSHEGGRVIFEDSKGGLWMGNSGGLFYLDRQNQHFLEYLPAGDQKPLKNIFTATNFINRQTEEIWISSGEKIHILDLTTGTYADISHDRYPGSDLSRGNYISLFSDNGGQMWIGSNGYGISLFSPEAIKFNYPRDIIYGNQEPYKSSRDMSIRSFYQDPDNDSVLWTGTNEGLYKINRKSSVMRQVRFFDIAEGENMMIYSITGDKQGFIWLGIAWGLIRFDPVENSYKLFDTALSFPGEGNDSRVNYVHFSNGNIWVLTPYTIARLDMETEQFEHIRYNFESIDEYREAVFPSLIENSKGDFWIAAKNGLHYFDVNTRKLTTYPLSPYGNHLYKLNDIRTVIPDPADPQRFIWLGTGGGGLIRFDIQTASFRHFTEKHGLSNNMIYGILSDDSGNLWMSTNRGLSKFNIAGESFTNYTKTDGLQSNEFNSGAYYENPWGEMFFGGIYGYNSFFPSEIRQREFMAPLVFTDFKILDMNDGEAGSEFFTYIYNRGNIKLSSRQNSFVADFAALDFYNPGNNRYAFSMTTTGENWVQAGKNTSVTFTELKAGEYTLKIRGTNSDGIWSNREAKMIIEIAAPWWQQNWVYFLYLIILAGIISGFRKYELSRISLKNRMRISEIETIKLKELNSLKSRFFSNISHEFRTPLTLIKGPLEQLSEEEKDQKKRNSFKMMLANASLLLQLINQLLDLSKLESDHYHIKPGRGDVIGLIKGIALSFSSLAEQKSIKFEFVESPEVEVGRLAGDFYYDPDIFEKIINNLLSNAIKFTPPNGSVITKICQGSENGNNHYLEIVIADTGIGIAADKLPYIYDRFYQIGTGPDTKSEGSGIGLAFVKELVRIHKATIRVRSTPGKGTIFSLRFPFGKDHFPENKVITSVFHNMGYKDTRSYPNIESIPEIEDLVSDDAGTEMVLVVEDHFEVRRYISDSIKKDYKIREASNVTDGIRIAEQFIPDLIISDIMMPERDGYEFCELLKTSDKTSHIPVILLTARTDESDRIMGLERGADDYLAKPFNVRELRARVRNLIDNRRNLREKFNTNSLVKPEEISVSGRDATLVKKMLEIVEENIDNVAFSVEDLGREAGMSQSQIHRKLKAIVNMPASQFIRSVRMHRAIKLLQEDAGNISEIAYMVGYDDPGYFSKSFRIFFGKLPSEIGRNQ